MNSSLGEDCSDSKCVTNNSACVENADGRYECTCTSRYVRSGSSCTLGPTRITSDSSLVFETDLSDTARAFGYINLDKLQSSTTFSTSASVHPDDGFLELSAHNATTFSLKLRNPLSSAKTFVVQLSASTNFSSAYTIQQIVTVSIQPLSPSPEVFQIFLLHRTRKNTVIADVETGLKDQGYTYKIQSSDTTVIALFGVTINGKIICGQDIVLENVTNNDVVAKEYVFSVVAEKSNDNKTVAELFVLIFKDVFTSTIEENWQGVIMSYSLSNPTRFRVKLPDESDLPDALSLSIVGTSIRLLDGVDYDTMSGGHVKEFQLVIETTDSTRKTTVTVRITVMDQNDNAPVWEHEQGVDQPVFAFTLLAGSYGGTVVGIVNTIDNDTVGSISYALTGLHSNEFSIDQSGALMSKVRLEKRKFGDYINLTIQAFDGKYRSENATIIVNLISVVPSTKNLNMTFSGTVVENAPQGTSVNNVYLANYTNYKFANPRADTLFSLNSSTGVVVTKRELDREMGDESYTDFSVHANIINEDQCFPVNIGQLQTTIIDVNDNPPSFSKNLYSGEIKEASMQGTSVTGLVDIQVSDKDTGPNADIYFSLNGTGKQYFTVEKNRNSFTIKTSRTKIDAESYHGGYLLLTARDDARDTPKRLTSTATLSISVLDINDHAPIFTTAQQTSFNVKEGISAFHVGSLSATDGDYSSKNNNVSYLLIAGGLGYFHIDEQTGRLETTQEIDREANDMFILTVQARDNGSPPLSAEINITVNITDVNDNAPEFNSDRYEVSIMENMTCPSPILTVTATDRDTGSNGDVLYSTNSSNFQVNATSGEIRCVHKLDYEQSTSHLITVTATDRGIPGHSNDVKVRIQVSDINDHPPQFANSSYNAIMTRGEWYSNKPILAVDVTDADSGINADITLSLSDYTEIFTVESIKNVGLIRVKKTSNKPTGSASYSFDINASDGSLSSQVPVVITVNNIDNSTVRLNATDIFFSMIEGTDYNSTIIGKVEAAYDPGVSVEYSLVSGGSFRIDKNTGALTCTSVLDREKTDSYLLIVRAKESARSGGDSRDVALLNITVLDVNDNAPVFRASPDELLFNVPEDAPQKHNVHPIYASDEDAAENGTVEYSIKIQTPREDFSIDPNGQIYVSRSLDREMYDKYVLVIKATDKGPQPLSATTSVRLFITDINDNPPVFTSVSYNITVKENDKNALKTKPFFVKATDNDYGINASITFRVQPACPLTLSDRPRGEGRLGLNDSLDFEKKSHYECVIIAMDMRDCKSNCHLRRSGSATLVVNVLDVNDNAPVFQGTPYTANVSRDADIGDTVLTAVTATDLDSNYQGNGVVKYFIIKEQNYFKIDRDSGVLTVATTLNAIEGDSFHLDIEARDQPQSGEKLTAQTNITIDIFSSNPRPFFNKSYSLPIKEEEPPTDAVLLYVEAFIKRPSGELKCSALNNCTYSIMDTDWPGTFEINPDTGAIRQLKKINREVVGKSFKFKVKVTDIVNNRFGTSNVVVQVEDINDNKPYFNITKMTVTVQQTALVGTWIGDITSIDLDEKNNPLYQILPDYINDKIGLWQNGTLFVKETFGKETEIKIEVNVTDGDKLEPSDDAIKDVNFRLSITIEVRPEDYNENAPVFSEPDYAVNLPALSKEGHTINVPNLKATDEDDDPIMYGILRGNRRDILDINPTTAQLSLQFDLDSSIPSNLTVIISAVDEAFPPRTGTCIVRITIVDPEPTQCVATSVIEDLSANSEQRTMFLALFIAMAALLTLVSAFAIVVTYKWRRIARRERYHHRENIQNQGKGNKDERSVSSGPLGYDSLGSSQNPYQDPNYQKLDSGKDFSAGVQNPAYVSTGQKERTGCQPPRDPLPDYDDDNDDGPVAAGPIDSASLGSSRNERYTGLGLPKRM